MANTTTTKYPKVFVTLQDKEFQLDLEPWERTWWKHVASLNPQHNNCNALRGQFLSIGGSNLVRVDSCLVRVKVVGQSYETRFQRTGEVFKVAGEETLRSMGCYRLDYEWPKFIAAIDGVLKQPSIKFEGCSDEDLIEELRLRGYDVEPTEELKRAQAKKKKR